MPYLEDVSSLCTQITKLLHAHLAARRFIATWDQPDVGLRSFPWFPIHFGHTPVRIGPAPPLGADNAAVCSEVLGYDQDHIARLTADGVLADRPPV